MWEFFLEQLDALQALDQLAPLTAAKEHLPGDIIDILSHLGKAPHLQLSKNIYQVILSIYCHMLSQMLPQPDECITEIQQQWTLTPFEDHIPISPDLPQESQVNTVELSFHLHFPNVTQQQINAPLVVHNDRTLKEFIQGEERCLKFIN